MSKKRVVVVTGGGAGIGAAIATELGRQGAFVITMDPLVTLDGSAALPITEETTAGVIVAAGGSARASAVSVTDTEGVRALFQSLVDEFGRLDAVINVAGISRPTSWTDGSEADWRAVLEVHVDGYRNVLAAALPLMAAAGGGNIVGVTSGSGWRAGDAGAYGCAKRAVASLTWQIGRNPPDGVVVNALSPIAVTRMVTAALERAGGGAKGGAAATGPLFGSMPEPEQIGPIGAHLASNEFAWCSGQVIFGSGAEVAVIEPPHLIEVVRTHDSKSLAGVIEAATPALIAAEAKQLAGGGTNPRFAPAFGEASGSTVTPGTYAVVADRAELAAALSAALDARGATCRVATTPDELAGIPSLNGVVVATSGGGPTRALSDWEQILSEHDGIVEQLHADGRWTRAVADYAAQADRPVRLVALTDATTAGGRSRAQASAQHARNARKATKDGVAMFAIAVEAPEVSVVAELTAHLLCGEDVVELSGAELVVGEGWFGLRSHPRPSASVSYGGPAVPDWLDDVLRSVVP